MKKQEYKDWSSFDIIAFLEDNFIGYDTAGKNVGRGFIGINECPFCSVGGNHFGVRLSTNVGSCWVCGEKGGAPTLVKAFTNLPWKEVYNILRKYMDEDRWIPADPEHGETVIFPEGVGRMNNKAANYLWDRGFDPEFIERKYKVRGTGRNCYLEIDEHEWNFSHRIIVPIMMERQIVAYTGRTYIEADPRYMGSPTEACLIPPASCIYNIDTIKTKGILVEGVTDVWRFGDECAAMMGVKFTDEQIHYLGQKNLEELFVLFDPGAEAEARKLCKALLSVVPKVKNIVLEGEKDPGDLETHEALNIKFELLGRV